MTQPAPNLGASPTQTQGSRRASRAERAPSQDRSRHGASGSNFAEGILHASCPSNSDWQDVVEAARRDAAHAHSSEAQGVFVADIPYAIEPAVSGSLPGGDYALTRPPRHHQHQHHQHHHRAQHLAGASAGPFTIPAYNGAAGQSAFASPAYQASSPSDEVTTTSASPAAAPASLAKAVASSAASRPEPAAYASQYRYRDGEDGDAEAVSGDDAGGDGDDDESGDIELGRVSKKKEDVLLPLQPHQRMVLDFANICQFVPSTLQQPSLPEKLVRAAAGGCARGAKSAAAAATGGKNGGSGGGSSSGAGAALPTERQVLHSISGHVLPGQVLALMGPSGSGKTSFLSILGGRAPANVRVSGRVTVAGKPLTKAMRRRVGFVLQDDVLYETLTVHETLTYAGLLRLPRTMPLTEKMRRVDGVLEVLGLKKSRDTIIGGFFRRGVSGGERKRVSVGAELLINPAVLMLDEPTSGLDSTTALHLVQLLRQLASGGRAVVTTIHQPSSRLYRQLDMVMLLAEGHIMYYGDAHMASDWFQHLGFPMPYGVNAADFILDCAMGEVVMEPKLAAASPYLTAGNGGTGGTDINKDSSSKRDGGVNAVRTASNASESYPGFTPKAGLAGRTGSGASPAAKGGKRDAASAADSAAGAANKDALMGAPAIAALYRTFETWYECFPEGFTDYSQLRGISLEQPLPTSSSSSSSSSSPPSQHQHYQQASRAGVPQLPAPASATNNPTPATLKPSPAAAALLPAGQQAHQQQGQQQQHSQQLLPQERRAGASSSGSEDDAGGPGSDGADHTSSRRALEVVPSSTGFSGAAAATDGPKDDKAPFKDGGRDGATYFDQVRLLTSRAIKVRRFESLSGQNFVQIVGVAIITGLLWFRRGYKQTLSAATDVQGLLFFELLFPAFRSLFAALFTFPNEFRILKKERPAGMYKLSAYYIARTVSDLPIELIFPTLFVIVVYFFGGLRLAPGPFFYNLLSILLLVLIAQSWGLLFGGTFMDPKAAQTVTTVVMLTFLLVGGFYVRNVPVWIDWIKYLSFIYWGFNLLLKIQFRNNTYYDASGDPVDVVEALELPTGPQTSIAVCVVVLFAMLVILRGLTYVVLRIKTAARAPGTSK